MKLWDNHMHTSFSGDCRIAPQEMAAAARSRHLEGITFTDHLDWDYAYEPGRFDLDIPLYLETMRKIAGQNSSEDFSVLVGLELGLQPHLAARHQQLLRDHAFDYVIGSTHVVHKVDPYYPEFFEGRSLRDAYQEYYECILENLCAFCDIDAIGHLDYVIRYGDKGNDHPSYEPFAEVIDAILNLIISRGIALEINTGAFRCGMKHPNPAPQIIRRYRELGGTLITLGADAHKTQHVALAYEKLPQMLHDCGFSEYAVYKNRTPHFYPLI